MKKRFPLLVFILLIIAGGYLAYQQFWSTPSVPAFRPYESDQLHNREGRVDPIILRNAEAKIASIQKTIDGFDETT
ncbi:hypothetical protein H6768_04735 [Candidatus Peribacteria bacterium]|nr:hypothetical protein [Candidatus Peribacteria bacterium]